MADLTKLLDDSHLRALQTSGGGHGSVSRPMTLTARQRREADVAVRHLGRALRALDRANIPSGTATDRALLELNRGERLAGQASDKLIDGLMLLDGVALPEDDDDD